MNDKQEITLHLQGSNLTSFVASLLGQRRSISKEHDCVFCIDVDWLVNTFTLIDQRIKSQNKADLVSFGATITYNNGKTVDLDSAESLASYRDLSSAISVRARLVLSYLIEFPYKISPERQDIAIICAANTDSFAQREDPNSIIRSIIFPSSRDDSILRTVVRYTDLSWGEDIHNILEKHIESCFEPRSPIVRTSAALASFFAFPAAMGYLMFSWIEALSRRDYLVSEYIKSKAQFFSEENSGNIDGKLTEIYNIWQFMAEARTPSFPYSVMWTIPILGFLLLISHSRRNSFISFNERSRLYRVRRQKRRGFILVTIVSGLAISIVGGLLTNEIWINLNPPLSAP